MSISNKSLSVLSELFAVCRLEPSAGIPEWALGGSFFSITKTAEECSVVCKQKNVPDDIKAEKGWKAIKVEGPLDFSETGILSALSGRLAEAGISLFVISTYDTDYILVREDQLTRALDVLR